MLVDQVMLMVLGRRKDIVCLAEFRAGGFTFFTDKAAVYCTP